MAEFIVNTDRDDTEGDDTLLSLREAVAQANARPGADTITFAAGVELVRLTQGTQIEITDTLTIEGGAGVTITGDAEGNDRTRAGTEITDLDTTADAALDDNTRLFVVGGVDATFRDLILTGGRTTADGERGGAVLDNSTLARSELTFERVTLAGNETRGAGAQGGAVYASNATVLDSTLSGNRTAGDGADGGGLFTLYDGTLINSTVVGNAAFGADATGGGLYLSYASLTNVTVTGNAAASVGGGLQTFGATTLIDSILVGNDGGAGDATDDISQGSASGAGFTFEGRNLIGEGFAVAGVIGVENALPSEVFAQVEGGAGVLANEGGAGVLANNGGPTATVLILLGGVAQDAGTGSTQTFDQRGEARPFGPGRDIGAVELQENLPLIVTTQADVTLDDGETTLREAVALANMNPGADTITFAPGVSLIRLIEGEIVITEDLAIAGGSSGVTITGDAAGDDVTVAGVTDVDASLAGDDLLDDNHRIFSARAAGADLTLADLTLTGGRTVTQSEGGAAVRADVAGRVTLERVSIAGNSTAGEKSRGGAISAYNVTMTDSSASGNRTEGSFAAGGAIYAFRVTLTDSSASGNRTEGNLSSGGAISGFNVTLTRSTVRDNATAGDEANGGGVSSIGNAYVNDSTISGNATTGARSDGGGLDSSNDIFLVNSTVSDNSVAGRDALGGGISAFNRASLLNSTVSGNVISGENGYGGGIYASSVSLSGSTVSGNAATGLNARGGGVRGADAQLLDSIVLGNDAQIAPDLDVGDTQFLSANIVGADAGAFDASGFANVVNAAPAQVFAQVEGGAGVLADNGGPTETILILLGGAAQDAGTGNAEGTDQRGEPRFFGLARDIGAVELQENAPLIVTTEADGILSDGELSLREAVLEANASVGANTIAFADGVELIRLTQGTEIEITDTLTIEGGAGVTITGDVAENDETVAGTDITDLDATDGQNLSDNTRLFNVTAEVDTTFRDLVLTGGRTDGSFEAGGALASFGAVTLERVMVSGNETVGNSAHGGGLYARSASLTNVTVSGNGTEGDTARGGGLYTVGDAELTNVTVSGNGTVGDNADGGGLYVLSAARLTNVTASGNSTNGAGAEGGGLVARAVTLTDSIVLGNGSVAGADEIDLRGEGSFSDPETLAFTGANIVGADAGAFDARVSTNVSNAAPAQVFAEVEGGAGVLADNGGPTQTVLILEGGAAQGTGRGADGPDTDQRGVARPQGEGRDIGAVELVVGQAPLLRDDALVLAFDGDGTISVPLSRLLANDEARDGSLAPGGVTVTGADARIEGGALVVSGAAVAQLAGEAVAPDGTGGASVTLSYGVTPPPDLAAPSAEVVLRMAAQLRLGEATAEADAGGRAVVDLSALREGGFGDVTISLGPVRATDGGGGGIGAVALSGDTLVFDAAEGSAGREGAVVVTIVDALGQMGGATIALDVAEAPDDGPTDPPPPGPEPELEPEPEPEPKPEPEPDPEPGEDPGPANPPDRPTEPEPDAPGRLLLRGTEGRDRIFGTAADERFEGLGARDVLVSGGGDDLMTGGAGPDFFAFARVDAPGTTEVTDFGPQDFFVLDDRFFGLGDATIDLRGVTLDQVLIAVRLGLVALDREAGTLSVDPGRDARSESPELTIALGDGLAELGVSDVFLA